jgi:hypothetical protein
VVAEFERISNFTEKAVQEQDVNDPHVDLCLSYPPRDLPAARQIVVFSKS